MRVRHRATRFTTPWRPTHGLLIVPLAIIATTALIDINTPETVHLGPFLIAAPALTAAFAGPGMTAAVGALAVVAQIVIAALHGGISTPNHEAQIAAVLVISVFLVVFRRLLDRYEQQLGRVRSVATVAQQGLLRPLPRRIGPLTMASVYIAAEAGAQIGGDLYAVVPAPGVTRMVVGDVRGSGLPAFGQAAVVLGAFRGSAYRNLSLPGVVSHIANASYWNMAQLAEAEPDCNESFVTALVLDVRDDDHSVQLVNCGHPLRCCCAPGTYGHWRSVSPRSRWGSAPPRRASTRSRHSTSHPATSFSSTPTESSRHATAREPSTRSPTGSPPVRGPAPSPSYATCTTTCCATSAGAWATTPS